MPRRKPSPDAGLVAAARGARRPVDQAEADDHLLLALSGALQRRMALTDAGTFDGERNVWASAGYPTEVADSAYELRYRRFGLARTIVDAYPTRCWARPPSVYETEDPSQTDFEKAWEKLVREHMVWRYLSRVDKLAGRGAFAVLLVGFDDGKPLDQEVSQATRVTFLRPYHPAKVAVKETEQNTSDPRYGMPVLYELSRKNIKQRTGASQTGGVSTGNDEGIKVHWTRVLHVADNVEERDWEGRHRLEPVFNHILDLEKIGGGSAEMFWRGGFPVLGLLLDKMATMTDAQKTALDDDVTAMFHGLTRTLRLQGIEPKFLSPTISDPKGVFEMQIQQIAAATGIPTRVLMGSEQARLASTQDQDNWLDRVADRQLEFCEPMVLRPFVDMLQRAGVLPPFKLEEEEVTVEWPSLKERGDKEAAEVAFKQTETICKYASTPGAEDVLPLFQFYTEILGWKDDKAEEMVDQIEEAKAREEEEMAQAEKEAAKKDALPIVPGTGGAVQVAGDVKAEPA